MIPDPNNITGETAELVQAYQAAVYSFDSSTQLSFLSFEGYIIGR